MSVQAKRKKLQFVWNTLYCGPRHRPSEIEDPVPLKKVDPVPRFTV